MNIEWNCLERMCQRVAQSDQIQAQFHTLGKSIAPPTDEIVAVLGKHELEIVNFTSTSSSFTCSDFKLPTSQPQSPPPTTTTATKTKKSRTRWQCATRRRRRRLSRPTGHIRQWLRLGIGGRLVEQPVSAVAISDNTNCLNVAGHLAPD